MTKHIIFGDINIEPLLQARKQLTFAIKTAKSDLEKTGSIKCFEYCYELSWKLMEKILMKKGIETNSPRDAFRISNLQIKNGHSAHFPIPLSTKSPM